MNLGQVIGFWKGIAVFRDEQNRGVLEVSPQIQKKLAELAELVAAERYGEEGASKELTFREIEEAGYQLGQLAAEKFATTATKQQARHFAGSHPCPQCGKSCQARDPIERQLLTRLGAVHLPETEFRCDACRRSFFPSASGTST